MRGNAFQAVGSREVKAGAEEELLEDGFRKCINICCLQTVRNDPLFTSPAYIHNLRFIYLSQRKMLFSPFVVQNLYGQKRLNDR